MTFRLPFTAYKHGEIVDNSLAPVMYLKDPSFFERLKMAFSLLAYRQHRHSVVDKVINSANRASISEYERGYRKGLNDGRDAGKDVFGSTSVLQRSGSANLGVVRRAEARNRVNVSAPAPVAASMVRSDAAPTRETPNSSGLIDNLIFYQMGAANSPPPPAPAPEPSYVAMDSPVVEDCRRSSYESSPPSETYTSSDSGSSSSTDSWGD